MLRLWRDEVKLGLFASHVWLHRRRQAPQAISVDTVGQPAPLAASLEQALDNAGSGLRPGTRLAITISDSAGALVALPWTNGLSRQVELKRYAEACFERAGISVNDEWAVNTDMLHFGGGGLGYAVPRGLMIRLNQICEERGFHVSRIAPMSAMVHRHFRLPKDGGVAYEVVIEMERQTLLAFSSYGLLGMDVEAPARGLALSRLLRRAVAHLGPPSSVRYWCESPNAIAEHTDVLKAELGSATVSQLYFNRI